MKTLLKVIAGAQGISKTPLKKVANERAEAAKRREEVKKKQKEVGVENLKTKKKK